VIKNGEIKNNFIISSLIFMAEKVIQSIKFDERGLIPAIVQDTATSEILWLGFMDNASLLRTLQTGQAHFVSADEAHPRWQTAHRLLDVRVNADGDSITIFIEQETATPEKRKPKSLLKDFNEAQKPAPSDLAVVDVDSLEFGIALQDLYALIAERKAKRPEGSYTTYLFNSGIDKILKKIAEESGEVIIAAKNKSHREMVSELSDLFYHLLVLMVERDIKLADVHAELKHRASQAPSKPK
jgi:phosphoribosyl-ATP pyrophosphohydrolase/phosphoribosyl-AMP cyclohydrolase